MVLQHIYRQISVGDSSPSRSQGVSRFSGRGVVYGPGQARRPRFAAIFTAVGGDHQLSNLKVGQCLRHDTAA